MTVASAAINQGFAPRIHNLNPQVDGSWVVQIEGAIDSATLNTFATNQAITATVKVVELN